MKSIEPKAIRDSLVALVGKAIDTGAKGRRPVTSRDKTFYEGRSTAFVYAAATILDQVYGLNFERTRKFLAGRVRTIRTDWTTDNLRDGARVGEQAEALVVLVMDNLIAEPLADQIIEGGPYAVNGVLPEYLRTLSAVAMNELRAELMEGRIALAARQAQEAVRDLG